MKIKKTKSFFRRVRGGIDGTNAAKEINLMLARGMGNFMFARRHRIKCLLLRVFFPSVVDLVEDMDAESVDLKILLNAATAENEAVGGLVDWKTQGNVS